MASPPSIDYSRFNKWNIQANYEPKTIFLAAFLLGAQMIMTSLISMYSYVNTQRYDASGNPIMNRDSNYLVYLSSLIYGIVVVAFALLVYLKPDMISDLGSATNGSYTWSTWFMWILILLFGVGAFSLAILSTSAGLTNRIPQNNNDAGSNNMNLVWFISYATAIIAFFLCFVSAFSNPGSIGKL